MAFPLITSNTQGGSVMLNLHGGAGVNHWKRFVTGLMLFAEWDSFEHNTLEPGGIIGEHVHSRTEEIYFIVSGRGLMTLNDDSFEVIPGDLVMTPLNGRHSIRTIGQIPLRFIVVEALPPSISKLLPSYEPEAGEK